MLKKLRNYLLTGLIILVPVAITIYIVCLGFNFVDGILRDWIKINGKPIPGLGLLVLVLLTLLTGFLAQNYFGKKIISLSEDVIARIPLVNKIYSAARNISQTILTREKKIFQEVVAIQYPAKGIWTVGFVTSLHGGELDQIAGEPTVMVFVCTVPNPTTGFVVAVPRKEAIPLKMTVEEAIRLVLSAGVSIPGQPVRIKPELFSQYTEPKSVQKI